MSGKIVSQQTLEIMPEQGRDVQAAPSSMLDTMTFLAEKGIQPEQIEKMMILHERDEANKARKAFNHAMAQFNKMDFTITKSEHVSYTTSKGTTEYYHADLAKSLKVLRHALAECGLNLTFTQSQDNKGLTVTAWLSHELGHRESTSMSGPYDTSGGKNAIQSVGSTDTYLKRYTAFALTGVAAEGMDDDGKGSSPPKFLEGKKLSEIYDLMAIKISDQQHYLAHAQNAHRVGASFDEIPEKSFIAIRSELIGLPNKDQ